MVGKVPWVGERESLASGGFGVEIKESGDEVLVRRTLTVGRSGFLPRAVCINRGLLGSRRSAVRVGTYLYLIGSAVRVIVIGSVPSSGGASRGRAGAYLHVGTSARSRSIARSIGIRTGP
jgi:hypothetical protein